MAALRHTSQLQHAMVVNQQILRFQVPMENAMRMTEPNARDELLREALCGSSRALWSSRVI